MDELRLSLLILGTCFIVAVLAHGIWKIRKSKPAPERERIEPRQWEGEHSEAGALSEDTDTDNDGMPNYDDLGLGQVRVVSSTSSSAEPADENDISQEAQTEHQHPYSDEESSSIVDTPVIAPEETPPEKPEKLYGSVVSNPKPHLQSVKETTSNSANGEDIPAPPEFLIKKEQTDVSETETESFSLDSPVSESDHSVQQEDTKRSGTKRKTSQRRRQEPTLGDDQMHIDFDTSEATVNSDNKQTAKTPSSPSSTDSVASTEQEVLVVNVRVADESPIAGAALLPLLLTLGFKFGDQDIFHRHVNANGKGPVLFSLANMFKPGVFDIDNLENFSTHGVSLFMILPIEGDAHQVFNMMHNAARKIADEFDGQILDGRRSVLTKQGLQQYMEKIREFERKRMISRR